MQMYIFVANKFKNSNLIFHFIITITPRQCNLHYVTTLNLQEVSSQAKFKLFLLISNVIHVIVSIEDNTTGIHIAIKLALFPED